MSRLIQSIAKKTAKIIVNNSEGKFSINVIAYSLEAILGELVKFTSFALVGVLFGCFIEMITVSIFYGIFRIATGGPHCTSYMRCLVMGIVTFLVLAKISSYGTETFLAIVVVVNILLTTFVTFRWVPGEWHQRKLKKTKKVYRNVAVLLLIVNFIIVVMIMIKSGDTWLKIGLAMQLGVLWQFINLTPLGYKLIGFTDQFMLNVIQSFCRKGEML